MFAWASVKLNLAERQRRSAHQLRQVGAVVRYDYESGANPVSQPPYPPWLVEALGRDVLCEVREVSFAFDPMARSIDGQLSLLKAFPGLRKVDLARTPISDSSLDFLQAATQLESLAVGETRITDAAMNRIRAFSNLRRLNLSGTTVTDFGLQALEHLRELRHLNLDNCENVGDPTMKIAAQLPHLRELRIQRTQVTQIGLQYLAKAP
ncbi:MAG: hypothetical protein N2C14_24230, partial [Planctomycetales bacterium]